jgi:glucose/arabinose dehydrogenase
VTGRRAGGARLRFGLAGLLALGLVASAAACGGDDDDSQGDERLSGADGTEASGETTTTAPPAPGEVPLSDVELEMTEVAEADAPTAIVTRPGNDQLYVVEREGRVRQLTVSGEGADRSYEMADDSLIDISDDVVTDVERGLLDVTFSPDGNTLYVHYSLAPDGDTRVDAYTLQGETADTGSRRELLAVEQPYPNHNGGDIEIGPDGFLYIALGDGGDAGDPEGNGQDTGVLLGKILRIDPATPSEGRQYSIPEDNPFADGEAGEPEIWIYGVRNPWRIAFDAENGDLWVADVGQNEWEEIDLLRAADGGGQGANLGWDGMEGNHEFEGGSEPEDHVGPVYEYSRDEGCSITGGVVYRGQAIPGLVGTYLFSDYCEGQLRGIRINEDTELAGEKTFDTGGEEIVSFGVDAAGEVYVVSLGGTIYRVDAAG